MRAPGSPSRRLALLALVAACGATPAPVEAPPPPSAPAPVVPILAEPPASPWAGRIVAVADLHGDLQATRAALGLAGLLGPGDTWIGGDTVFVQTGDVTDRGDDARAILDLLDALEEQAASAGGRVVQLLGNHEIFNLRDDLISVTSADIASFGGREARRAAFSPAGPYGRRLRGLPIVARMGDTVFVHGGIPEAWARMGVDGLNDAARRALAGEGDDEILGRGGPLWYRDYLRDDEDEACAEAGRTLAILGVRRMVMGHTVQEGGQPVARCGGALLGIDTGASRAMEGKVSVLEIMAGDARALLPSGVVDLPDPPGALSGGAGPREGGPGSGSAED